MKKIFVEDCYRSVYSCTSVYKRDYDRRNSYDYDTENYGFADSHEYIEHRLSRSSYNVNSFLTYESLY